MKFRTFLSILAAMFFLTGNYAYAITLNASALASAEGVVGTEFTGGSPTEIWADNEAYSGYGYAYSGSYADTGGDLYAFADGGGRDYNGMGTATWSETFTNTSGADVEYTLDFWVSGGFLDVWSDYFDTGESVNASYMIDIDLSGSSIWSSEATLTMDGSGASFSESGTSLNGMLNIDTYYSWYDWDSYADSIGLGTYADGESFTLTYSLGVRSWGDVDGMFYDDYGMMDEMGYYYGEYGVGGSMANIGDPLSISGISVTSAPVPEPATIFLLGSGLFGMIGLRKKKTDEV